MYAEYSQLVLGRKLLFRLHRELDKSKVSIFLDDEPAAGTPGILVFERLLRVNLGTWRRVVRCSFLPTSKYLGRFDSSLSLARCT